VSRRHLAAAIVALSSLLFATQAAAQAPSIELHEIDFYVHVDTLGATPIGDYQTAIDDALVDARLILQGEQGPADSPCCTELTRPSSLVTFGTTGDGLDVIDFGNDLATLRGVAGTGVDAVFIVDAISHCGGVPSPGAIGCAETPGDIEVITLGALDRDLLGATVAHERGHNANLLHSMGSDCDMMDAIAGGSCLSSAECTAIQGISTSTSGTCPCLASATSKQADGTACVDGPLSGICSGGVCGDSSEDAGASLVGAVDLGNGVIYDDLISGSGLTGDYQLETTFGSGAVPNGLAYSADRGVLYGVQVSGLDGELLEIDPATGAINDTTTITGRPGLISLAYDPGGPGASDDRLLAVDRQPVMPGPSQDEDLIEIDPDDGSVTFLCNLAANSQQTTNGFFSGLAYDASAGVLLGNGEGGLFEIDGVTCAQTPIPHPGTSMAVNLARSPGALGYSASTGLTFMAGSQGGTTLYTTIDAGASPDPRVSTTYGIDDMTLGGLAALPIPEPSTGMLGLAALLGLAGVRRARRYSTAMRPTPRS
jgi:hypothetical protein